MITAHPDLLKAVVLAAIVSMPDYSKRQLVSKMKERRANADKALAAKLVIALSQQLAVLRNAGLVKTRKDAKLVYYRIDDDRLAKVVDAAGDLGGLAVRPTRHPRQPAPGVANFAKLEGLYPLDGR